MARSHQPHFFQPLLPGFQTGLNIPISFYSRHLHGKTSGNTWTLRSDASDLTWEVLQEERTLTRGWQEFAEAHDLRVGDIMIVKLEGPMSFHVSPFGPSCCEIQYTAPQVEEEAVSEEQHADGPVFQAGTSSSTVPTTAYSWDYSFRADVTETNVQEDKLVLPVEATGCKALNKQCKEAILVNINGKAWTVPLRFSDQGGFYYTKGWRKFCHDNKCRIGDGFVFNVVGDGMSSPLFCVYAPSKEILKICRTRKRKLKVGEGPSTSRMNQMLV